LYRERGALQGSFYVANVCTPAEYVGDGWKDSAPNYSGGNSDWTYGSAKNRRETYERFRDGRPTEKLVEAFSRAESVLSEMDVPPVAFVRRRATWSETDGEPDVDRALSGSDRPFRRRTRSMGARRVVKLGWSLSINSEGRDEDFVAITSAMVATVDTLERAGYAVELYAIDARTWNQWNTETAGMMPVDRKKMEHSIVPILVKSADAPLDTFATLALGMSGILRDFGFQRAMTDFGGKKSGTQGRQLSDGDARAKARKILDFAAILWCVPELTKDGIGEFVNTVTRAVETE
jgi:hypothetical protein